MSFRKVFRRDTGEPVRVPEHWLEHRILGAPFVKTAPKRGTKNKDEAADAVKEDKKDA